MNPRTGLLRVPLPPDARAAFDRLLRLNSPGVAARKLGVSRWTVEGFADGGLGRAESVAKVSAALRNVVA